MYSAITLISELSGIADILFVTISLLLGAFYTPMLLRATLLYHTGVYEIPKKKIKKRDPEVDEVVDASFILKVLKEAKGRFKLNLSLWLMMA